MNICVTGASQGLGKELCLRLAAEGHSVWGVARGEAGLAGLHQADPRIRTSIADVRSDDAVRRWRDAMTLAGFEPDAVMLCASVRTEDMNDGLDTEKVTEMIDSNLTGSLRCVEAFLPSFLKRKRGTFVLIASTTALRPSDGSAGYSASKAGIAMAFRTLRLKYATSGVRFKTVYLGPMATKMWEGKKGMLVASPQRVAERLARFITEKKCDLYYPAMSTWLLRMSMWVPDGVFRWVSGRVMK